MQGLILKLHSIGAIKFGSFEIKKDFIAPFQVDFSRVISNGAVAKEVCKLLWEKGKNLPFDLLCGVPLAGGCLANYMAWEWEVPLVVKRPDLKIKGISTKIAGTYKSGQRALVIQDVCLYGEHTLDLIEDLEAEGVVVRDVLAFLDLSLGWKKKLKGRGYVPHHIIGIAEVVQILFEAKKLSGDSHKLVTDFLETHIG